MKASKEQHKWGMQHMAQMHELSMDRAQVGQNKDLNMLRWGPKGLGMQAKAITRS